MSAESKAVVMDIRENEVDIKFRAVGNYAYPESVYARINWTVIEFY